ncbi:5-bromo-4-chloroindolyl phosphate hydrolysis family protein [Neofamilia massiliensis]|uniref:5-bromo-4-chloroindolyl phosphate hydrolysis family protein n=1 Tax=Neofamilia massiliensis TaxID=1673724 RepID=UPI0006BB5B93|nr:5-bromo-4-chloroindolyl phosphate hydrolysis family protein [Neofamilia massiliensis]
MTKEDLEKTGLYNRDDDEKLKQLERDLEKYRKDQRDQEIKDSLKEIGDATLSSLVSISTFTADALDKIVSESMAANKKASSSDLARRQMKADLEVKKKNYLEEQKKVKKAIRKKKKKVANTVWLISFLTLFLIFSIGVFKSLILAYLASYAVKRFYQPKLDDYEKMSLGGEETKPLEKSEKKELSEYEKLIKDANKKLDIIYSCFNQTKDGEVQVQAGKLYERGLEILSYLKDHPDKISKASRFLSYYLDTAANICDKYREIEKRGLVNEDTEKATENAKRAMVLLEKAFDNEFMKLIEDDIIDIETDMKVLENSMKWDNYID